jgi:hypothetical protein
MVFCRWLLALVFVPVLAVAAKADEAQLDKKTQEALDKKLNELKAPKGDLYAVSGKPLESSFPKFSFAVLRYPQFPVARVPDEPLKSNNLFAIDAEGKVELITERKGLEKFFLANAVASEKGGRIQVLQAWLRLSQELYQDGFYKFTIDKNIEDTATSDGTEELRGKVVVSPEGGNKGEIVAKLTFKKNKLVQIEEEGKLTPGMRPRCQATRLLDKDPIIRYMAEQSILIMGRACKPYLDEQRAKASPELQKAIDRIWQRILDEDR